MCISDSFMGSICDNFAGDGVLLEGTSIWKDKLGELVADERITVSFAPGTEGIVSGQSYTGEGYIAQDFDFIKNGRLESFLDVYKRQALHHARSAPRAFRRSIISFVSRSRSFFII